MSECRPPRLPYVTAIVLAGGRARRFGRDKLSETVDGRPLIAHAVEGAARLTREVVVAIPPDALPPAGIDEEARGFRGTRVPVRLVHDPVPFGGPLVGVRAALEAAAEPLALVVAGDMPRLRPAVLELLVRTLGSADPLVTDAVALVYRSRRQPLPVAVRVGAATEAASRALGSGDRSLRGLLANLRVRDLAEAEWRPLDPDADTLLDVDRPHDLDRLG